MSGLIFPLQPQGHVTANVGEVEMYLEKVRIQNVGPLADVSLNAKFKDDGNPLPIVIVGQNGAGKSLFMGTVVNALVDAHSSIFEDADVKKGMVFKLRTPQYIRHGETFYASEVAFTGGLAIKELQLAKVKSQFEVAPTDILWNRIPDSEGSHYDNNFHDVQEPLTQNLQGHSHLYFPPNRFEDPAWLNVENLTSNASYASLKHFRNYSNRPVVTFAPLRDIQNWLLDVIYDSFATEQSVVDTIAGPRLSCAGTATDILGVVAGLFKKLLKLPAETSIQWSIGGRSRRRIGLSVDGKVIVNNIFGLSTGEVVLLGIFLSIIRDYDLSTSPLRGPGDVQGIVVIDEVDMHLHTELQFDLLPQLISMFPKVQFILTTHSPLFVLGMARYVGADNFQLHELPSGLPIDVERFSEFKAAFERMKETAAFDAVVRRQLESATAPSVYFEGTTDIDYIRAAAQALGRPEVLSELGLFDGGGSGNLTKIWDARKALSTGLKRKVVLIYDCDTRKQPDTYQGITKYVLEQCPNRIASGIENLFPDSLIERVIREHPSYIDVCSEINRTVAGQQETVPESWSVSASAKRNLCDWILQNAEQNDFRGFREVVEMLAGLVPPQPAPDPVH